MVRLTKTHIVSLDTFIHNIQLYSLHTTIQPIHNYTTLHNYTAYTQLYIFTQLYSLYTTVQPIHSYTAYTQQHSLYTTIQPVRMRAQYLVVRSSYFYFSLKYVRWLYVLSEGHITTHKISPLKQYFFHTKPKFQLRLFSLGVKR